MEPEAASLATVSETSHGSLAARGSRLDRAWRIFFPVGVQRVRWPGDRDIAVGEEPYVVIADGLEGIPASLVARAQGLIVVSRAALTTGDLRRLGFDHVRRWTALPRLDDVRWLMPVDGAGAALGALDLYTPYRRRAQLARRAARAAVHVGALTRMSTSLWVARRDEPAIVHRLAEATGLADLRLAMQLGRRGRIPKLTSGVLDPRGGLHAIARIAPRGSPATILMQRELDVLSALRDRFDDASPGPYVHASGNADGFDLTVQTIIPGRPVGTRLDAAGERFLGRLGGGLEGLMGETEQVRSLIARASNAAELPAAASAMAAIASRLESARTPKTIVHGDFAPWNSATAGRRRSRVRLGVRVARRAPAA